MCLHRINSCKVTRTFKSVSNLEIWNQAQTVSLGKILSSLSLLLLTVPALSAFLDIQDEKLLCLGINGGLAEEPVQTTASIRDRYSGAKAQLYTFLKELHLLNSLKFCLKCAMLWEVGYRF